MKLVILDNYALTKGDLDFSFANDLVDEVESYGYLPREQQIQVSKKADLIIINKTQIDKEFLDNCPLIKYVGIIATGTDNIDIAECTKRGITVSNVPSYSTNSVAQLTFALLLEICQSVSAFHQSIMGGDWRTDIKSCYNILPLTELACKTIGVVGYGNIAKAVIKIALAFGLKVLVYTKTKRENTEQVTFVDLDTLLSQSDIITLHCPATPLTENIINQKNIEKMKDGVILINTARGKLCDETAVANALNSGKILAFGADVLAQEPIVSDSPFYKTKNVFLTPHVAWATTQSLERLLSVVHQNLKAFVEKKPINVVK